MPTKQVELTIPPFLKDEPIIYRMGNEFRVVPRIIEASFSSERGWAYLALDGEDDEIERCLAYLVERGITVDRRY